jgi:hypothetical protein
MSRSTLVIDTARGHSDLTCVDSLAADTDSEHTQLIQVPDVESHSPSGSTVFEKAGVFLPGDHQTDMSTLRSNYPADCKNIEVRLSIPTSLSSAFVIDIIRSVPVFL